MREPVERAAIDADVVRAETGAEPGRVQHLDVELRDLDEQPAAGLVPVHREEAVDLLHAAGAIADRGDGVGAGAGAALRLRRGGAGDQEQTNSERSGATVEHGEAYKILRTSVRPAAPLVRAATAPPRHSRPALPASALPTRTGRLRRGPRLTTARARRPSSPPAGRGRSMRGRSPGAKLLAEVDGQLVGRLPRLGKRSARTIRPTRISTFSNSPKLSICTLRSSSTFREPSGYPEVYAPLEASRVTLFARSMQPRAIGALGALERARGNRCPEDFE